MRIGITIRNSVEILITGGNMFKNDLETIKLLGDFAQGVLVWMYLHDGEFKSKLEWRKALAQYMQFEIDLLASEASDEEDPGCDGPACETETECDGVCEDDCDPKVQARHRKLIQKAMKEYLKKKDSDFKECCATEKCCM